MVKKLKELADSAADSNLSKTVRDSAQQIWLAGLGAFAKAQEEGGKMFEALVKEGRTLEARTRDLAQAKVVELTQQVGKAGEQASSRAAQTWDKLESVFEDRVARALSRLGVPTNKDLHGMTTKQDALTAAVQELSRRTAPAKSGAKRAPKRAAKA
ncbi:MAG: phasin family protein [Burkholderiales bacterium]